MTRRPGPHRGPPAIALAIVLATAACGSSVPPVPSAGVSATSSSAPASVAPATAMPSASSSRPPAPGRTAARTTAPAPTPTPTAGSACTARAPKPTPPQATRSGAGTTLPAIALEPVVDGLTAPLGIVSPRDGTGRLFVVEQGGLIRIVEAGRLLDQPFLDLRDQTRAGGERGLLGLAFHPDYACDRRFYVDYTDARGDTVVAEYRVSADDPDVADPTPLARLLHIDQPFPNHNGGQIAFGPDGFLYVGMGDGGSGGDPMGNGQRLDTLLGKLLRLDVDRRPAGGPPAIPGDNCRGCPRRALPEIDAYGLRNPWRFSFDRATGDLWLADVGQGTWEEIDHVALRDLSGTNFGWSVMEGDHCYPPGSSCPKTGITLPVAEYDHSRGDCSVTGGYVYRGMAFPELAGWYLFSDYCSGRIRALSSSTPGDATVLLESHGNIATFGEDENGDLYVADISWGTLSRIVAAPRRGSSRRVGRDEFS